MFICLLTLLIISIIDNFAIIVSSVSLIAIRMRCGVVLIKDYNNSSVYGTECRAAIAQFIVGIRSSVFIDFAMKSWQRVLYITSYVFLDAMVSREYYVAYIIVSREYIEKWCLNNID